MPISHTHPLPVDHAAHPRRGVRALKRLALWGTGLALSVVATAALVWGAIQWDSNFHEVEPQRFYRSAQMDGPALRQAIKQHGIKTVLNLRGTNRGEPWYEQELSVTQAEGVTHLDMSLSAYRELSPAQMAELARLMADAPKPLLVHCESGADRTGLASALYKLSQGVPLTQASDELSARYGHFPMLVPRSAAMDRSLTRYAASLGTAPANATATTAP